MEEHLLNQEMPMGLGMALAQNLPAMQKFARLSQAEQNGVIARTQSIRSKSEMQAFVDSI